jgi:exonuclease SbcC
MINRLKSLEIEGFRSFQNEVSLDLDADVILIYGKNGSGKTSLVSAIEMAITGSVYDLARFTDDYPRCLKNVKWEKDGFVRLSMVTPDGEARIERVFDGSRSVKSEGYQGTKVNNRFFTDRCYLSQSRLTRLLELYQAPDGENPEQLLVRFVRELLGLGVLENLTAGLYEVGDIRRLESASTGFYGLRRAGANLEQTLQATREKVVTANTTLTTLRQQIKSKIEAVGDPLPNEAWEQTGVSNRITHLSSRSTNAELVRLRETQGRVSQVIGYISQISAIIDATEEKKCEEELREKRTRSDGLIEQVKAAVTQSAQGVTQIIEILQNSSDNAKNVQAFEEIKILCESALLDSQKWAQSKVDAEREVESIDREIFAKQQQLQNLGQQTATQNFDLTQRQLSFLTVVVDRIIDNGCPVCRRDYSEMKAGSLKGMVESEIQKLGGDVKAIEASQKQTSEISASLSTVTRKRETAEARIKEISKLLENLGVPVNVAQSVLNTLKAHENAIAELATIASEEVALTGKLQNIRIRLQQIQDATRQATLLADELGVQSPPGEEGIQVKIQTLQRVAEEQLKKHEFRRAVEDEIFALFRRIELALKELQKLQADIDTILKTQTATADKLRIVESRIELARRLSRAASNAKTKLLNQVFNETLNRLWRELYSRLAKSDDFVPQLAPPVLTRGKIETHIAGTMNGVTSFHNFSAVSSLGNLNTAALSLFLALNLVEMPKHHVLILDDPVQNMDDLHVIQFAALLRSIAFQARRQLVVAVHEKALFDYLALELGPSKEGDTLNLVTVHREGAHNYSQADVEKRFWKPDKIEFVAKRVVA